ncbi:hypothetical protein BDW02DRAFT_366137 [Decorospora gaudefroyi]|uniref:Uncharacterized protein n=1 Tax=Decorospora gaudefroyi TaxID=184978 RepID=A0A6A5KTC8_9PLEO|nr:hypothetical protein BDW02DRAFT_366137 [Decorospora gaudefroyi]
MLGPPQTSSSPGLLGGDCARSRLPAALRGPAWPSRSASRRTGCRARPGCRIAALAASWALVGVRWRSGRRRLICSPLACLRGLVWRRSAPYVSVHPPRACAPSSWGVARLPSVISVPTLLPSCRSRGAARIKPTAEPRPPVIAAQWCGIGRYCVTLWVPLSTTYLSDSIYSQYEHLLTNTHTPLISDVGHSLHSSSLCFNSRWTCLIDVCTSQPTTNPQLRLLRTPRCPGAPFSSSRCRDP